MSAEVQQEKGSFDWSKTIEEMWQLALRQDRVPPELVNLRNSIIAGRDSAHLEIIEQVAQQANVDLNPIYEEIRRRNRAKRRSVTRAMEKIKAEVTERAIKEREHREWLRTEYLQEFGQLYKELEGNPDMIFEWPAGWRSSTQEAAGCLVGVPPWGEPPSGTWEEYVDEDISTEATGAVLFSRIYADNGPCRHPGSGETDHLVSFSRPIRSFHFHAHTIRVDLWATGYGSAVLGDDHPDPSPHRTHSFVDLRMSFTQVQHGVDQGPWFAFGGDGWPACRLFSRAGDYADAISIDISHIQFSRDLIFLGGDWGGGDICCHVHLRTHAQAWGSDGEVELDFATGPHQINLARVILTGDYRRTPQPPPPP